MKISEELYALLTQAPAWQHRLVAVFLEMRADKAKSSAIQLHNYMLRKNAKFSPNGVPIGVPLKPDAMRKALALILDNYMIAQAIEILNAEDKTIGTTAKEIFHALGKIAEYNAFEHAHGNLHHIKHKNNGVFFDMHAILTRLESQHLISSQHVYCENSTSNTVKNRLGVALSSFLADLLCLGSGLEVERFHQRIKRELKASKALISPERTDLSHPYFEFVTAAHRMLISKTTAHKKRVYHRYVRQTRMSTSAMPLTPLEVKISLGYTLLFSNDVELWKSLIAEDSAALYKNVHLDIQQAVYVLFNEELAPIELQKSIRSFQSLFANKNILNGGLSCVLHLLNYLQNPLKRHQAMYVNGNKQWHRLELALEIATYQNRNEVDMAEAAIERLKKRIYGVHLAEPLKSLYIEKIIKGLARKKAITKQPKKNAMKKPLEVPLGTDAWLEVKFLKRIESQIKSTL